MTLKKPKVRKTKKKATKKKRGRPKKKVEKKFEFTLDVVRQLLKEGKPEVALLGLIKTADHEFMVRYLLNFLCASKFSTYSKALTTFSLVVNNYLNTKDLKVVEAYKSKLSRMETVERNFRTLHSIQSLIVSYIINKHPQAAFEALNSVLIVEVGLLKDLSSQPNKYKNRVTSIAVDLAAHRWENGKTLKVLYGE